MNLPPSIASIDRYHILDVEGTNRSVHSLTIILMDIVHIPLDAGHLDPGGKILGPYNF